VDEVRRAAANGNISHGVTFMYTWELGLQASRFIKSISPYAIFPLCYLYEYIMFRNL
jgi:hypothetical protein